MSLQKDVSSTSALIRSRGQSTASDSASLTPQGSKSEIDDELHEALDKLDEPKHDSNEESSAPHNKEILEPKPVTIRQLFRFATKLDITLTLFGTFFSIVAGAIMPVMIIIFSQLMGVILDYTTMVMNGSVEAANHHLDHESRKYCLWFMGLGLVMWLVSYGVNACWSVSAENQGLRIRKTYYESIMRQDIGWFDTIKTGELTTRITNDVNLVQDGIGEKFGFVFMNVVSFVAAFIIAFIKGWKLTLVCLCVIPFIAAAGGYLGIKISQLVTYAQDQNAESGAVADEVLSGIRTVMAFNGQEREIARYDEKINEAYKFGKKNGFILGGSIGVIQFFIYVMYCVGFNFGSWRVRAGEYEAQTVLNVILVLLIGGFSLSGAAPNISAISTAQGSAAKVYAIIDRESPIDPLDSEHGKKVDHVRGQIDFKNIHFSYPSRPDVPILKGFNLEIRPGQKVALVGESGCGKSTTIGLIERFYDPAQGDVLIDGINIKDYNIGSL
ncbi:hypothetical protein EC988_005152, partial [Linderina pennispora]